jgi:peptidoglycan/LPS O-acetylase OafA/YrhL
LHFKRVLKIHSSHFVLKNFKPMMKIVDSFFVISSFVVAHHRRFGRRRPG